MPAQCGKYWTDKLNTGPEHPQHRCTGQFMHKGIHICGSDYKKDGKTVHCGAVNRQDVRR